MQNFKMQKIMMYVCVPCDFKIGFSAVMVERQIAYHVLVADVING
jgi:hypothetical protein